MIFIFHVFIYFCIAAEEDRIRNLYRYINMLLIILIILIYYI